MFRYKVLGLKVFLSFSKRFKNATASSSIHTTDELSGSNLTMSFMLASSSADMAEHVHLASCVSTQSTLTVQEHKCFLDCLSFWVFSFDCYHSFKYPLPLCTSNTYCLRCHCPILTHFQMSLPCPHSLPLPHPQSVLTFISLLPAVLQESTVACTSLLVPDLISRVGHFKRPHRSKVDKLLMSLPSDGSLQVNVRLNSPM